MLKISAKSEQLSPLGVKGLTTWGKYFCNTSEELKIQNLEFKPSINGQFFKLSEVHPLISFKLF
jgi:hypothetical protein